MPEIEHHHPHSHAVIEEDRPEPEETEDQFEGLGESDEDTEHEDLDVENLEDDDETDEVDTEAVQQKATKAEPKTTTRKRGDLPEGYVTPIGLAKELSRLGYGKDGTLAPQVVYSYIKNAPASHPFPMEEIEDSLNNKRNALKLKAGVQWWKEMRERVEARKANAAAKKTTVKKTTPETSVDTTEAEVEFEEVED